MIVGHLGVAAALARWCPRASPGWIVIGSIAPDILDVAYAGAGVCSPYGLYSHTVPALLLCGATLGGAAWLTGRRATAIALPLAVLLHLPPDYLTGRKLLWPGGELHGLRLYDRRLVDFLIESALLVAGWALIRRCAWIPVWARAARSAVLLVAVQGGMDAFLRMGMKPTACAVPSVAAAR